MCQFISFFHNPATGRIKIHDLMSHHETSKALKLDLDKWREGHYLKDGTIECRVVDTDKYDQDYCDERLRAKHPTFKDFLVWCLKQVGDNYRGSLDLSHCDLKGVEIPDITGSLNLSYCNLKGVKIPENIGGSLDLSHCNLKGVKLPENIGGFLDLSHCNLEGVKFPENIGGWLYLSYCDLEGIEIPDHLKNKVIK